jgi:hypothetical protein
MIRAFFGLERFTLGLHMENHYFVAVHWRLHQIRARKKTINQGLTATKGLFRAPECVCPCFRASILISHSAARA